MADPGVMWERQAKRAELLPAWWRMIGGRPGLRILDAGSGPGYFAIGLHKLGADVTAMDVDEAALSFLRAQSPGLRAMLCDLESTPLPDGFDVAMITDVLHHVHDPARVLRNLASAARMVLVAEFDPAGPGKIGPEISMRIAPESMTRFLRDAGWAPDVPVAQAHEHYAILARRVAH